MSQNAINQQYFMSQLGQNLPNVTLPLGIYTASVSGDNDLYTVPAGRRCIVYGLNVLMNTFSANGSLTAELKSGGSYYTLGVPFAFTSATSAFINLLVNSIVLEAGESISVNSSSATTYNYFLGAIEFDNTSGIKGYKTLNMASGNNLLYTVPVGKSAAIIDSNSGIGTSNLIVSQQNTTSFTYYVSIVPNGQTIGPTYKVTANTTISGTMTPVGSALSFPQVCATLTAGDKIYVNTSSAASNAFISVLEL